MSDMTTKRRGEGSTRLRSDGRYEYRYVVGKKPDSKALYKSFTVKTERELKRKVKEYNQDRSKYTVRVEASLFHEYAKYWMKIVKCPILKPVSYYRIEQTNNAVCNYTGCIRFGRLSSEDIQAMINDLSHSRAYSAVRNHYEFVRGVFKYESKKED